jgi:hypothetical protein
VTETPHGRDGTTSAARTDRPRRPPPAPISRPGVPADTLAMLLLLVVILLVITLGSFSGHY